MSEIENIAAREPTNALWAVIRIASLTWHDENYNNFHATAAGATAMVKIGKGWYRLTCVPVSPPKNYCKTCGQIIKESER